MIFENMGFYFREALLSFRRSALMSMATILSITTIVMAAHDKLMVDKANKRVVRGERGRIIEDTQRGIY